jgi:hypothetical protein
MTDAIQYINYNTTPRSIEGKRRDLGQQITPKEGCTAAGYCQLSATVSLES